MYLKSENHGVSSMISNLYFVPDLRSSGLPEELQSMRKLKVKETAQAPDQFTSTTKLPAIPFMLIGKICHRKKF
jgi:hypothetical protein